MAEEKISKEKVEKIFDLLNDEGKFEEILDKFPIEEKQNAKTIYENFCLHPLDFFKLIKKEYKDIFIELILKEIA